jgi:phosphoglucomutase
MLSQSPCVELAKNWQALDPNPSTFKYVGNLVHRASQTDQSQDRDEAVKELESLFPSSGERISFGTAGLRSAMKPGPLGMNDLTVIQTAQGLARYYQQKVSQNKIGNKICAVVGYDHRCNPALGISSLSFAVLTTLVFAEAGIDCILLDGFVLTPLVPFALQRLGGVCGVMVTASHNPKQDDGYKVYASDACQIRAPMDKEISDFILDNLEPWIDYQKVLNGRRDQFRNDPCLGLSRRETTQEMLLDYFETLKSSGLKTGQAGIPSGPNSLDPPTFAYTAMHGIGYPFAKQVFETFELAPFQAVLEQKDPDPNFPTVPFPNPEEKGALDLAKKFASESGCDIVLANDPDADRLAIAEKDRSTGEWTVFSGDQIGTMLGLWIWEQIGSKSDKVSLGCYSGSYITAITLLLLLL